MVVRNQTVFAARYPHRMIFSYWLNSAYSVAGTELSFLLIRQCIPSKTLLSTTITAFAVAAIIDQADPFTWTGDLKNLNLFHQQKLKVYITYPIFRFFNPLLSTL